MTGNFSEHVQKLLPLVEAVLFLHGEPMTAARIAKAVGATEAAVEEVLTALHARYADAESGVTLVRAGAQAQLATKPAFAAALEAFLKEEMTQNLTPAAQETLAIAAYLGPISRAEIDYIRGVNSTFIVRSLLLRGLVDRTPDPARGNVFVYTPSIDLLKHLGIAKREDLPEYASYSGILREFKEGAKDHEEIS